MTREDLELPGELRETWEVLGLLGTGAMGRVLEVRHRREGFVAAIKVTLAPQDEKLQARLGREALALARVQHPGVVRIFDGGVTAGGEAYVVMERLEGYSLDEAPPPDPRAFMADVAGALAAVHAAGLLHRDIKPGNLFLTREGQAKLVDFGLVLDPNRTRLTATGMVAGTPIYMAPELLRLAESSPASDWFAFGVTLHALLEGAAPYGSEEFEAVCHGNPYPPPHFERVAEGDPVRTVLRGLLQSDPDRRLADAGEVARGLAGEDLEFYVPPGPAPARPRSSRGLVAGALGLAVLLGFTLGERAPQPTTTPSPSPPVAATQEPLRALAATRKQWAEVDEAGRRLFREPPPGRLYPTGWYLSLTPTSYRTEVRNSLLGEARAELLGGWEGFVGATRAWLVALRAAGRDHGDPQAALTDPEVRVRLHREVLPRLSRLLEQQLLRWSLSNDPTQVELALIGPEGRAGMKDFVNASQELLFALEEWGRPPPPPLLHVWVVLPRSLDQPIARGPAVLTAARRAVREANTPAELWWAVRTLRLTLDFGLWFRDLPWQERLDAFAEVRSRMDAVGLQGTHRGAIAGQLLAEVGRLGRTRLPIPDQEGLRREVEAWRGELLATSERRYRLAGEILAWRVIAHADGPWHDDSDTSEFRKWYWENYRESYEAIREELGWPAIQRGEPIELSLPPPRPRAPRRFSP